MIETPVLVSCPECDEVGTHKGTCRFSEMFNGPGRSVGIWAIPQGWHVVRAADDWQGVYQQFCRDPELCRGRGSCPWDPACNE